MPEKEQLFVLGSIFSKGLADAKGFSDEFLRFSYGLLPLLGFIHLCACVRSMTSNGCATQKAAKSPRANLFVRNGEQQGEYHRMT